MSIDWQQSSMELSRSVSIEQMTVWLSEQEELTREQAVKLNPYLQDYTFRAVAGSSMQLVDQVDALFNQAVRLGRISIAGSGALHTWHASASLVEMKRRVLAVEEQIRQDAA